MQVETLLHQMQVQILSLPTSTLSPSICSLFVSPAHHPTTKLLTCNLSFTSGLCNLLKRMSKSPISLGNRGGLAGIRCGVVDEGSSNDDGVYIRRCVEIARKAIGCTSPNPMVGCVIVKDGKVVGEGFHPKAGQPHAEVFALRDAGDLAENATAYISLEPCNHYGRTPPCTEALIKAKVKRVVVGMVDPNPIVAAKGVDKLRDVGIEVTVGIEEELCKSLNESYIHQMLIGKPFVTLRYSLSVNGKIVDGLGEGAAESGGYYSRLLQEYDAVILSSASITEKFSIPASQEPGANQPLCIIAAGNHSSSFQISDFLTEAASKMIIFSEKDIKVESKLAEKGIETVVVDEISLDAILEYSKRQGFCSVLLDLRGSIDDMKELLQEGIEKKLLQKIVIEVVPMWVEGSINNSFVALKCLDKILDIKKLKPRVSGKSVLLEGYF